MLDMMGLKDPKPKLTENLPEVEIWTDGSCEPNPGPGGWGAILIHGSKRLELNGFLKDTTNNRAELIAVIESVKKLKKSCHIKVYSDNNIVTHGGNALISKTAKIKAKRMRYKKNMDLWGELVELCVKHRVEFHWVKGHSGIELNERADQLASEWKNNFIN